ncbi:MAG: nitroreductase family protein [Anaerobacillus sp.]|uniref:nitroreductase family protein n=1 Tax=Anaerobacillus sp. TaxID=1872506 RepID=UPI00391AC433
MSLRFENWFKAIKLRRSRRTYVSKQIELEVSSSLQNVISELNERYEEVRLVYIEKSPEEVFVGAVGPYGKITGAVAYFALVLNEDSNFSFEKAGFIGQAIVLEAATHGLSTCWVGGHFNKGIACKQVNLDNNEKVVAVIPVGYARKNLSLTEKMMNQVGDYHKRKSVTEIVDGLPEEQWPEWLRSVISAASLSPSAYNRQSVQFIIGEDESITIKIANPNEETNVPKGIDRGIAMLHIEVATKHHNINGNWQFNHEDNVVIFRKLGQ